MTLLTLAISGYRSIRDLALPLDRLTIVTGRNGSGKSSFYRALRLLADVAQGRAIAALAAEGGLQSTLWAGPERLSRRMKTGEVPVQGARRKDPVGLRLGFSSEDYGYAIDLGLPILSGSAFGLDPEIKAEAVWAGEVLSRRNLFASRAGPAVTVLDRKGARRVVLGALPPYDSMMTHAAGPGDPELLALRDRMRDWRFYDHIRTDRDAPARRPRTGTRTPVLASDGADLAAALQTLREIGDAAGLAAAIEDAFPGSAVEVAVREGRFETVMRQPGLLRPLGAAELSEGTLRYLLLVAALLTPRPPGLMVLNEPEASLHADLLGPLARLIAAASRASQIVVVTHSPQLAADLAAAPGASVIELAKDLGETTAPGVERPPWAWPTR